MICFCFFVSFFTFSTKILLKSDEDKTFSVKKEMTLMNDNYQDVMQPLVMFMSFSVG